MSNLNSSIPTKLINETIRSGSPSSLSALERRKNLLRASASKSDGMLNKNSSSSRPPQCVFSVPKVSNISVRGYSLNTSCTNGSTCILDPKDLKFMSSLKGRRKKSEEKFVYLKLFVYWLIMFLTWLTLRVSNDVADNHSQTQIGQYYTHPTVTDQERAIFLISMGRQAAESKIVERFVMSTRRRGSWKGYVVLLTDAPFDRYSDLEERDDEFIVMHPNPHHFNWETKQDMPYKRFKTYVLDYVDSDSRLDTVELVYYLDIDIIVGNGLSFFFDDIESKYNVSSVSKPYIPGVEKPTSNIYFFKGNFAKTPVQGGQIILERDSSKPCLLWWRSFMDTHTDQTKDQPFLKEMMHQNYPNNPHSCKMTVMDQEPHLHFPSKESVRAQINLPQSKRSYPSLIHIKNTGKVRDIPERDESQYISDILHLPVVRSKFFGLTSGYAFSEIGVKMHFDPDEPPWSPGARSSGWSPTYAQTNDISNLDWYTPPDDEKDDEEQE